MHNINLRVQLSNSDMHLNTTHNNTAEKPNGKTNKVVQPKIRGTSGERSPNN